MEPIPLLTYTVTSFFGTDMGNYIRFRSDFEEIKLRLDKISSYKT
jgi:hypothetical protein